MNKNQKGFSLVEVLLVVVVVGLIGGIGWYVYQQRKTDEPKQQAAAITNFDECVAAGNPVMESYPEQCHADGQTFADTKDGPEESKNVTFVSGEQGIRIFAEGDVDKLPDQTPDSFKEYMKQKARNPKFYEGGCRDAWTVIKVSKLNVYGGLGGADKNGVSGEGCGGGAAMFWYLQDGVWKEYATQMATMCNELAKMKIYAEFIPVCYSSTTMDDQRPNPNGSIDNALKAGS